MFITFEGIDGSGKTTQMNLVSEYLIKSGFEVLKLREPGGNPFSEMIREILLNKENIISPIAELLLFNAARTYLVENIILPALKENKIVICDRFYDSTTAYQAYGRKIDFKNVISINEIASLGLKPDITFYLSIDLETHHRRTRYKNPDRMESSGDEFYSKVIDGYNELSEIYTDRIYKIKSLDNIDGTFQSILKILKEKLSLS